MYERRRPAVGPPLLWIKAGAAWTKPVKGFRHAGDPHGPWSQQSAGKLIWMPAAREQGCHGHVPAWWLGGEHGEGRKARQEWDKQQLRRQEMEEWAKWGGSRAGTG